MSSLDGRKGSRQGGRGLCQGSCPEVALHSLLLSPLVCLAKHRARASQEEGGVPALLDPSHDTKHLSKWERPMCALRPLKEAGALGGISLSEAGA